MLIVVFHYQGVSKTWKEELIKQANEVKFILRYHQEDSMASARATSASVFTCITSTYILNTSTYKNMLRYFMISVVN